MTMTQKWEEEEQDDNFLTSCKWLKSWVLLWHFSFPHVATWHDKRSEIKPIKQCWVVLNVQLEPRPTLHAAARYSLSCQPSLCTCKREREGGYISLYFGPGAMCDLPLISLVISLQLPIFGKSSTSEPNSLGQGLHIWFSVSVNPHYVT